MKTAKKANDFDGVTNDCIQGKNHHLDQDAQERAIWNDSFRKPRQQKSSNRSTANHEARVEMAQVGASLVPTVVGYG